VFHGIRLGQPDFSDWSHSLAVELERKDEWLFLIANAYWEPLRFELPDPGARRWTRVTDTALAPPDDATKAELPQSRYYEAAARSFVLLEAAG
jgi:glycogen operon protein